MSKLRNHDGQSRLGQKSSLQILPSCRKESAQSSRKNGVVRRMFDSISDMQRAQKATDHSVALLRRNQQILLQRSDSLTVTCQRTSAIVDQLLALFSLKPASVSEGSEAGTLKLEEFSDGGGPRAAKMRRASYECETPVGREMSLNEWSESVMVKAEPCDARQFTMTSRDFKRDLPPPPPPPPSPPPPPPPPPSLSNGHDIGLKMCDEVDIHEGFCCVKEETIEAFP